MCGIVGAAGSITFTEEKMVKTMLQLDTIRGPHSTGLFGGRVTGANEIFKKMGTPWEVSEYKGWDKFWSNTFNILIGHNRWATQGAINHVNAHPFNHDHIYGVHNGSLNKSTRKNLLDDSHLFEVDSENLYYHMAKNGVDDTVKNLDGAFALVWHDANEGTLNMTRNDQRTLYFCYSKDRKTIFWASEDWMIHVAAAKHGVKIQEPRLLKTGILFSIPIPRIGSYQCKPIGEGVIVRDLEFYKPYVAPKRVTNYVAPKKNNVVTPIRKDNNDLAKYLNQTIRFRVDGLDTDQRCGMDFLDCSMEGTQIEVRYFFEGEVTGAIEDMVDSDNTYEGVVRSYSATQSGYLCLDPRTITVVEVEEEEEKKRQQSLH